MKRSFSLAALIGLSALLTSCINEEQKTVVNADGTGKFTVEQRFNLGGTGLGALGMLGKGKDGKDDAGRSMAVSLLAGSCGVDVWTSAAGAMGPDGIVVRATGYAKDLSKLKFSTGSSSKEKSQGSGSFLDLDFRKDDAGILVIEGAMERIMGGVDKAKAKSAQETPKDPAARKEKRTKDLVQMEAGMGMMASMMKDAKISVQYNFGSGEVLEHGCFKLVDPSTVRIEVKPMDAFKGLLEVMKDDELGEIMDSADEYDKNNPQHQKVLNKLQEAMYGGKPRVVVKLKGNAFDYNAEVEKTKASQSEDLKQMLKEAETKRNEADAKAAQKDPAASPEGSPK